MSDSVILACASCKAKNRIPLSRIKDGAKCGKCGAALPMENLGKVFAISDANFEHEVMGSGLPVLVDCWAPWCGPCRAMAPVLDDLARKYQAKVKIVKLNVDENPVTGSRFSITSIPTMLLVKNGQVKDTLVGALPRGQMEAAIERII